MATAVGRYTAAAVTDRGRKRPSNEDAYGFSVEAGVYVVCDGMGGAAAGEVASTIAVDEILRQMTQRERGSGNPLPDAAQSAVSAANEAIYSRAQRNRRFNGMGTTLVVMVTHEHRVWILNVGDSRCYRLRNGRLQQLTLDHSLVEEQVRLGRMTPNEALHSQWKNVITRALGTQPQVTPDIFEMEAEAGDLFLLCSDGLTRELSDRTIESVLSRELSLEMLSGQLVEEAKRAGGHDNITCLLVRAQS